MIDDRIAPPVTDRLLRPLRIESAQHFTIGLSGAWIFRCRDDRGESWALRRWPAGTAHGRIDQVRQVMRWTRQQGCEFVPRLPGSPAADDAVEIVAVDSQFWDLSQWMPGEPLSHDADLQSIQTGAAAIARFHQATRKLGTRRQPPPAVGARLARLDQLDRVLPAVLGGSISGFTDQAGIQRVIERAADLLRLNWTEVRQRIRRSLIRYQDLPVETQCVLRDVHREHLLFEGGKVSGLIDFDAIREDTPVADLARWVGSFEASGGIDQVWDAALAGYFQISPSPPETVGDPHGSLGRDIAFATTWIGLANWVVWMVVDMRQFSATEDRVVSRIGQLIRSASWQS
ncbi:MAG: phosphotransferase [Pirellulales bacterium]|nr:phosphotransferase [Pirellulales bacterium]